MIKQVLNCPHCGLPLNSKPNYLLQATKIFKSFPANLQNKIKACSNEIRKHIPSDIDISKQFQFLTKIKNAKHENIYRGCMLYLDGRHWFANKGFNYLAAIILNEEMNRDVFIKRERKRLGGKPPDIK